MAPARGTMPEDPSPSPEPAAAHPDAYAVAERLAIGHAGVVYRAVQTATGREVILKMLAPDAAHPLDHAAVAALRESIDRVQHPCIAELVDAHEDPEGFVIAHAYCKGIAGNLFPAQRKLTPAEGRLLGMQLLGAVLAGERASFPHGDIKPSNVVISDDPAQGLSIRLLDWGLSPCRATHPQESLLCMAPERLRGGGPSVGSDLFSTGVTLTFLLTGFFPVHGEDADEILGVWQRFNPGSIATARPDLDEHFCRWLGWLMRLEPEDRPATVARAREVLEQVIAYASHKEKVAAEKANPAPPAPTETAGPPRTTAAPRAAAAAPLPVNPIAAATLGALEAGPHSDALPRRTLGSKILLGLLVLCGFLVAFAGLGWWAESHYGSGWIAERWQSILHPAPKIATPTPPATASPSASTPPKSAKPGPPPGARESFQYPAGPTLDGLAGGNGWTAPWQATGVEVAQSPDKKSTFARIGGAREASARRAAGPFQSMAQKGVVLVFNLWHPGAEGVPLTIDALGGPTGSSPAPLTITPKGDTLEFSLGGSESKVAAPAGKSARVVLQWGFKRQRNGKYDVDVRLWLNPDPKARNPVAKSPGTRRILKNFAPESAIVFSIAAPAGAKRGATFSDLRMAPALQEALR